MFCRDIDCQRRFIPWIVEFPDDFVEFLQQFEMADSRHLHAAGSRMPEFPARFFQPALDRAIYGHPSLDVFSNVPEIRRDHDLLKGHLAGGIVDSPAEDIHQWPGNRGRSATELHQLLQQRDALGCGQRPAECHRQDQAHVRT